VAQEKQQNGLANQRTDRHQKEHDKLTNQNEQFYRFPHISDNLLYHRSDTWRHTVVSKKASAVALTSRN